MNILGLTYTNIGPFAGETKTVVFQSGSTLVSAPIGSGKSFLFFDGPLFALYKYSSRPMLSRTTKTGSISCVFQYEGQWYLILRQLKPTKSGNDSVQSRLWTISTDPTGLFADTETLNDGDQLSGPLQPHLEEVSFTSGKELDESMKALLPPRELVQSVYLLMQESEHVFELPAGQRINVFKHLFGLIGIDQAKDKLTDRRKELTTTLKILQDSTDAESKFKRLISSLRSELQSIRALQYSAESKTHIDTLLSVPTFHDVLLLESEVSLTGFEIAESTPELIGSTLATLQDTAKYGYTQQAQITTLRQSLTDTKTQISGTNKQLQLLQQQHEKATHLYKQLDTEKAQLQQHLPALQTSVEQVNRIDEIDASIRDTYALNSLEDVILLIQETIQSGKDIASQIQIVTQRQQTLQDKKKVLEDDITALQTQIQAVSVKYDQQMKFHCDKIEGPCPYVEAIKGSATKGLAEQRDLLTQQHQLKTTQLQALITDPQTTTDQQTLQDLNQKKRNAGLLLGNLQRKTTTARREDYTISKKQYDTLLQKLQTIQTQRESITLPDPQTLTTKREMLQSQQTTLEETLVRDETALEQLIKQYDAGQYQSVDQVISHLQTIKDVVVRIQELIITARDKHQRIQDCTNELTRNKHLTKIFSKELMVVALQDFLPNLESVINTFLDEVVDYQIRFLTPETVSDTLELDIEIHDHRGVRQVKSLSGGQRATLKIAWILAVSSLFHGQFLFLDETITSLDADAVARIARLIESYMKKRQTKLLLVTHAPQIQSMEMRDQVVNI